MQGYVFVILAAIQWGMTGPVAKLVFQEGIGPLEAAFWRALIGSLFFTVHAFLLGEYRLRREDVKGVLGFSFIGVSVFFGVYQTAIKMGGAALASVLLYTAPAWVALMSKMFLAENLTRLRIISIMLTLVGAVGVSFGSNGTGASISLAAIGFGLLSGLTYAMYFIFGKIYLPKYKSPTLFMYILPLGALGLLPFITFTHKSPTAWAALAFLGLFTIYGAYYCYCAGLKRLETTKAAIVCTLEPVVAAVTAYFWWGEKFTFYGYLGSAVIFLAVVLTVREGSTSSS